MIQDIALLAVIVATLTQLVKGWKVLAGVDPRVLSAIVGALVVVGALLVEKKPLDLNVIIETVAAILTANGGKRLLSSIKN
jgi:hypothetical protein